MIRRSRNGFPAHRPSTGVDPARYLDRIGMPSNPANYTGFEDLVRLQRAHVTTVPFENLSIVGDPFTETPGSGVSLALPGLYAKIVERERGGFCYELNGLFGWLLAELGYSVDRLAGMVIGDDGDVQPPANHHTNLVSLDRPYVVDVGLGIPTVRRPIPLDGTPVEDGTGTEWRIVESERPDTHHLTQFRETDDNEWTDRYYFSLEPRELSYFEASCDFLQSAPESPFTGDPVVTMATTDGHLKLTASTLTHRVNGESTRTEVPSAEWYSVLEREFGLALE